MLLSQICFMYMSAGYEYADPEVLNELSEVSHAKQQERISSVGGLDDAYAKKPLLSTDLEEEY